MLISVVIKCYWSSAALTLWIRWVLWGTMLSSGTETFSRPRCRSGLPLCAWRLPVLLTGPGVTWVHVEPHATHSPGLHTACPLPVMNDTTRFRLSDG